MMEVSWKWVLSIAMMTTVLMVATAEQGAQAAVVERAVETNPFAASLKAVTAVVAKDAAKAAKALADRKKAMAAEAALAKKLKAVEEAKAKSTILKAQQAAQVKVLSANAKASKLSDILKKYQKQLNANRKKFNEEDKKKKQKKKLLKAKRRALKKDKKKRQKEAAMKKQKRSWGKPDPNAPEWARIPNTAFGVAPTQILAPASGEGYPNADYGEDNGVPDASRPGFKDPAPTNARGDVDNTAMPARDIIAERKKPKDLNTIEDPFDNPDKKATKRKQRQLVALKKVLARQKKLLKKFRSPAFAKSLEKAVLKKHHCSNCTKVNGTATAAKSLIKKTVAKAKVAQKTTTAKKTTTTTTKAKSSTAAVRATPKPTTVPLKTNTATKVVALPKKTTVTSLLEDSETILQPMSPSEQHMVKKKGKKKRADATPREEEETIVGDVIAVPPSGASLLPIALLTDGDNTFPVDIHKVGPSLLTKIGQRLAVKGEPIDTDQGDEALEVSGFKVQGPAVAVN